MQGPALEIPAGGPPLNRVVKCQGAAALERVPPGITLHVDVMELSYIDHACLTLLMN